MLGPSHPRIKRGPPAHGVVAACGQTDRRQLDPTVAVLCGVMVFDELNLHHVVVAAVNLVHSRPVVTDGRGDRGVRSGCGI